MTKPVRELLYLDRCVTHRMVDVMPVFDITATSARSKIWSIVCAARDPILDTIEEMYPDDEE